MLAQRKNTIIATVIVEIFYIAIVVGLGILVFGPSPLKVTLWTIVTYIVTNASLFFKKRIKKKLARKLSPQKYQSKEDTRKI